jgi:hypothetical protein
MSDEAAADSKPRSAGPKEPLPGAVPVKDPNPPDAQVERPPPETPKVGSRDAPGG